MELNALREKLAAAEQRLAKAEQAPREKKIVWKTRRTNGIYGLLGYGYLFCPSYWTLNRRLTKIPFSQELFFVCGEQNPLLEELFIERCSNLLRSNDELWINACLLHAQIGWSLILACRASLTIHHQPYRVVLVPPAKCAGRALESPLTPYFLEYCWCWNRCGIYWSKSRRLSLAAAHSMNNRDGSSSVHNSTWRENGNVGSHAPCFYFDCPPSR